MHFSVDLSNASFVAIVVDLIGILIFLITIGFSWFTLIFFIGGPLLDEKNSGDFELLFTEQMDFMENEIGAIPWMGEAFIESSKLTVLSPRIVGESSNMS